MALVYEARFEQNGKNCVGDIFCYIESTLDSGDFQPTLELSKIWFEDRKLMLLDVRNNKLEVCTASDQIDQNSLALLASVLIRALKL
jgi:hypothetical protein